ncbi:hypothetical protein MOP88_05835 [Sphingomonas sp. WKB10]|nr:hypothetical protein [Sphingomonas sp. WKB10]
MSPQTIDAVLLKPLQATLVSDIRRDVAAKLTHHRKPLGASRAAFPLSRARVPFA